METKHLPRRVGEALAASRQRAKAKNVASVRSGANNTTSAPVVTPTSDAYADLSAYQWPFQTCHNQPAPQSSKRSLKMSHLRPGSVYCACHTKGGRPSGDRQVRPSGDRASRVPQVLLQALCTAPATRKARAAQRRPRVPQVVLKALRIAPATRKARTALGTRGLATTRLCVLRLPHDRL